jgi:hypothetical protein
MAGAHMLFASRKPKLPDGREIRELTFGKKKEFTQIDVFRVQKLLDSSECMLTIEQHDSLLNSAAYAKHPNSVWRCRSYVAYQKDPAAPLGEKISWFEHPLTFEMRIPDVPVKISGNEISLRKACGMVVYPSISLLEITQKDDNLFVVSVVDEAKAAGVIRVVDFMRDGWALTDRATGLPLESLRTNIGDENARTGKIASDFACGANGWHGSPTRFSYDFGAQRTISVSCKWAVSSRIAVVNLP